MQGLSFIEAVAYILGGKHGASSSRRPATSTSRSSTSRSSTERSDANRRLAREMWASASSAAIIAGTYFPARAITIPIPPTIREHGSLKHTPTGLVLPAIVAAVQGPDGRVRAIQRIFLTQDYSRKAGVQKPKMTLGRLTGGAVRLGPDSELWLRGNVSKGLSLWGTVRIDWNADATAPNTSASDVPLQSTKIDPGPSLGRLPLGRPQNASSTSPPLSAAPTSNSARAATSRRQRRSRSVSIKRASASASLNQGRSRLDQLGSTTRRT